MLTTTAAQPGAARVAARLGRPLVDASGGTSVADLLARERQRSSILICLSGPEFTLSTVNAIIDRSVELGLPVGLLPVPGTRAEAAGVVERIARAPRQFPRAAALYCDFVDGWASGEDSHFGRTASTQFMARVGAGVETAVIHAHGNGGDFRVGEHVLCVKVGRRSDRRPSARHLPCWGSGPCRLDHKSSFVAFHGPRAIRARIVAFLSCATVQTADGLLDPADLFVTELLAGPETEVVLASLRINFGTPELGPAVLRALTRPTAVGRVALQMNQIAGFGPPSMVCIGDPEVRARQAEPVRPRPRRAATSRPSAADQGSPLFVGAVAARMLQSYLVRAAVRAGDIPAEPGVPVAELLDRSAAAPTSTAPADEDEVDRRLCVLLGMILGRRGPDVHDYLSAALTYGPQSLTGGRHFCGERLLTMRLTPSRLTAGGRELFVCERCGFAASRGAAETAPEAVALIDGHPTMIGDAAVAGWWSAAVQPIGGHEEPSAPVRLLPAGPHAIGLPVAPAEPVGLRRVAAVVVRAGEYQVVQAPVGVSAPAGRQ